MIINCANCKKEMDLKPWRIKKCKNNFCNQKCLSEYKEKEKYKKMCENVGEDFKIWLKRKYLDENLCTREIAEIIYGNPKNKASILRFLHKYEIPLRVGSDAIKLQWKDNDNRREQQRENANRLLNNDKSRNALKKVMKTKEYIEKSRNAKLRENNPNYIHGKSNTRLFNIWRGMKKRCYHSKTKSYKYYGAKGVIICDEWLDAFVNFYNWAMQNGYKDTLTIDRINPYGNYEPSNCRWATIKEQANNKRKTR